MTKLTLNSVGDLTNPTTAAANINSNSSLTQIALENTVSRDGTAPNQMNSDFDMNSHRIINLPSGVNSSEPVTVGTFNAAVIGRGNVPVGGTANQVLAKTTSTDYDTHWANSVTSVGLALPADLTVTNSPVTTSGTLTGAWASTPTGTGTMVRSNSPTLVTPSLGAATATTINKVNINPVATAASLALADNSTLTVNTSMVLATAASNPTLIFQGTDTYVGRTTTDTLTNKTLVAPALGTPVSGVATNLTGTAAGLTSGNVTTNANLTGAVTSVGNGTSLGSFTSANLKTALTDETGSGAAVFANSPALVTPTGIVKGDVGLGNVDNTSDVTKWAATKTLTNTTYDTAGAGNSFSINSLAATANTGTGSVVRATSPTLVTPALGTPASGTLTNCTGLPISTGVSNLGTGVASFLIVPSSANLSTAVTDETGFGSLVFANTPTLITPVLGAATATTINGVTIDNLAWTTYTPTVTSQTGTPTTVSATGRYKQIGKTIICQVTVSITTIGTAAGYVSASTPFASTSGGIWVGSSYESSITGNGGISAVLGTTSAMRLTNISAATYWVNGYIVNGTVTYEIP